MYIHLYLYVYMYIYTYIHTYIYFFVIYTCIHTYIHTSIPLYIMCTRTYIHTCVGESVRQTCIRLSDVVNQLQLEEFTGKASTMKSEIKHLKEDLSIDNDSIKDFRILNVYRGNSIKLKPLTLSIILERLFSKTKPN